MEVRSAVKPDRPPPPLQSTPTEENMKSVISSGVLAPFFATSVILVPAGVEDGK